MPMDFKGARKRAKAMLAPTPRPQDLSASALKPDRLRDNIIREGEEHTPRFRAAVGDNPTVSYEHTNEDGTTEDRDYTWTGYGECVRDMARGLFGIDEPQLLHDRAKVRPENQLGYDVAQFAIHDASFMESRPYSRMNEAQAMFGAAAMGAVLQEAAADVLAQHVAASEEMREASEAAQSADDLMEKLRQQAKDDVADAGAVKDGTRREIKQAMKAQEAALGALGALLQAMAQGSQKVDAAAVARKAAEAAKDAIDAIANLPGIEPGVEQQLDPEVQMRLAEKWSQTPELAKILREVGRWIQDMRYKRETRTKNVPIEPVEITSGAELDKILPHEMAQAYMDDLRPLFIKNWSEGNLLQWEFEGAMPAGKGPIICVVDGSLSMNGERFIYASSLCIACCTQARREKRGSAVVHFSSASELRSWVFPKGTPLDPDTLVEIAGHFFGGGTSIVTGMREAERIVAEAPEFTTADIVLIGDGQDHYGAEDQALRESLTQKGVRVHGISIMCRNNGYMAAMCDSTIDVTDLANPAATLDSLSNDIT